MKTTSFSGARELRAEVPARPPGAEDRDAHELS
jgi:hypothetical protein